MEYLTAAHKQPPRLCNFGNGTVATQILIDRGDTATLAANNIYPYDEEPGTPILGYNDYPNQPNESGVFYRTLKGTQEERDVAQHQQRLNNLQCTRLQARLELLEHNLWDSVMVWATNAGGTIQALFEDAQIWKFTDPSFQADVTALNLTEAQVISLLESAGTR